MHMIYLEHRRVNYQQKCLAEERMQRIIPSATLSYRAP